MARVQIINEVCDDNPIDKGSLCFQFCRYIYDDGNMEEGYRFIWRKEDDRRLQPARGQARLPSFEAINSLMAKAKSNGWGNFSDPDYKI